MSTTQKRQNFWHKHLEEFIVQTILQRRTGSVETEGSVQRIYRAGFKVNAASAFRVLHF